MKFLRVLILLGLGASMVVAAEEPLKTTAQYGDWLMQCSQLPTPAAAAKVSAEPHPTGQPESSASKTTSDLPGAPPSAPTKSCEVVQTFIVRETGATLAQLAIGKLPNRDEIRGVLLAPLGVYLADASTLRLDSTKEIKGIYTHCDQSSCVAEFAFSPQLVMDLRTAKLVTLAFTTKQRTPLNLSVSMKGFGAAYDAAILQGR